MQICTHVTRAGGDEGLQVQSMADRMVQYARACMMSITRVSPFESEFFFSLGGGRRMNKIPCRVLLVSKARFPDPFVCHYTMTILDSDFDETR